MTRLERIVAQKRAEVASGGPPGLADLPDAGRPARGGAIRSPEAALARPPGAPLRLMAEVKFASPSAGTLSRKLDAGERAVLYATGGAALVSVLCDATFFDGGYGDLALARRALDAAGLAVPILAKEFIVDPLQLEWARACGADGALLIARILDPGSLRSLSDRAREMGLEPFFEVTTEEERDLVIDLGARVVCVNARDLETLAMDSVRAGRVLGGIPRDLVAVHLSGLGSATALRDVASGRADAALIGEALMREDDPRPLLEALVAAAASR